MRLNFATPFTTQKQNLNSRHTHTHVSALSSLMRSSTVYMSWLSMWEHFCQRFLMIHSITEFLSFKLCQLMRLKEVKLAPKTE